MLDVALPGTEGVPELVRSFAACLASVTETPLPEVPQPRADLAGAIAHWRGWLAARGTGLVPIAGAARFSWPGYWLAVLRDPGAGRSSDDGTAVLMFGTPSGVVLRSLGYAEARRNVVTRGIDLNALVGRRFRIGDVECLGQRLCEPCAHLERLTSKGVLRGLIHRGGLRADVLTGGQVTTGAVLETVDEG